MDRAALIAAMQATAHQAPLPVEIDGWGTVYVRTLTVAEADEASEAASDDKNKLARAACRVICDETGRRMFDPRDDEDVQLLSRQPWPTLRKLLSVADPSAGKA